MSRLNNDDDVIEPFQKLVPRGELDEISSMAFHRPSTLLTARPDGRVLVWNTITFSLIADHTVTRGHLPPQPPSSPTATASPTARPKPPARAGKPSVSFEAPLSPHAAKAGRSSTATATAADAQAPADPAAPGTAPAGHANGNASKDGRKTAAKHGGNASPGGALNVARQHAPNKPRRRPPLINLPNASSSDPASGNPTPAKTASAAVATALPCDGEDQEEWAELDRRLTSVSAGTTAGASLKGPPDTAAQQQTQVVEFNQVLFLNHGPFAVAMGPVAVAACSDGVWRFFQGRKKALWAFAEGNSLHAGFQDGMPGVGLRAMCQCHNLVASGNEAGYIQLWMPSDPLHLGPGAAEGKLRPIVEKGSAREQEGGGLGEDAEPAETSTP